MKELTTNRKILVFLVFFALAAVLWLLDSLNQFYKTTIKIPVVFENLPKHKYLISELPKDFVLIVDGYGYDLLKYTLRTSIQPLKINLSKIPIQQLTPSDTNHLFFLTKDAENQISSQIKGKIKILDITPDTIFMEFTSLYTKKVPIKANVQIFYAKQYINKGPIQVIPDIVTIKGPSVILDTIQYIKTEPLKLYNVSQNINKKVKVLVPPGTIVQPNEVEIKVEVEQYTEVTISVPIKKINVPQQYDLKIFPDKATIKYTVGFSNYNKIHPENFILAVDYKDLETKPGDKLPVHVLHVPKEIYSFSFTPHVVDYIIESKND
jgi:YbbR domain-containing protein